MRFLWILLTQECKFLMSQKPPSQFISLDICGIPRMALDDKLFKCLAQSQMNGLKLEQNPAYL